MNENLDKENCQSEVTKQLKHLVSPDVLGFFSHFEVTQIFAFKKSSMPINVFSIFVATELGNEMPDLNSNSLLGNPIKIGGLNDWKFGIKRYYIPVSEFISRIQFLGKNEEWDLTGQPIYVGHLTALPKQFVPPDSTKEISWNRILKNNFWNGSYVFEWFNHEKTALQFLFNDPRQLQDLSNAIQHRVPLGIASLSDKVGNVVVQLPVNILVAKFRQPQDSGQFQVDVAWHAKAKPRDLRATCVMEDDGAIINFTSQPVNSTRTLLPAAARNGIHNGFIWDDLNGIILAATGPSAFISTFTINLSPVSAEPRVFLTEKGEQQVVVSERGSQIIGGNTTRLKTKNWVGLRMYRNEKPKLEAARICLEAFRTRAKPSRKKLLWKKAYTRWREWNFDVNNPETYLNNITHSQIDYAIVGYAKECLSKTKKEIIKSGFENELRTIDIKWHTSVVSFITNWHRILSNLQPFIHALNLKTTDTDWLINTHYAPLIINEPYWKMMLSE